MTNNELRTPENRGGGLLGRLYPSERIVLGFGLRSVGIRTNLDPADAHVSWSLAGLSERFWSLRGPKKIRPVRGFHRIIYTYMEWNPNIPSVESSKTREAIVVLRFSEEEIKIAKPNTGRSLKK